MYRLISKRGGILSTTFNTLQEAVDIVTLYRQRHVSRDAMLLDVFTGNLLDPLGNIIPDDGRLERMRRNDYNEFLKKRNDKLYA